MSTFSTTDGNTVHDGQVPCGMYMQTLLGFSKERGRNRRVLVELEALLKWVKVLGKNGMLEDYRHSNTDAVNSAKGRGIRCRCRCRYDQFAPKFGPSRRWL